MHTYHPGANITRVVGGAVLLYLCSSVAYGQADSQTFLIHGTTKSCSSITQLDSALSSNSQQFFAGWTPKDYADALAWSQACADYGWHVPGRPRIPLLQAQYSQAMGSAQTQNGSSTAAAGASGSAAAGGVIPAQAQTTSSAAPQPQTISNIATGSAVPVPAVQSAVQVQPQNLSSNVTGSALPIPAVQTEIPAQAQAASIPAQAQVASAAATGSTATVPTIREAIALPAETASIAAQAPGASISAAQVASAAATGSAAAVPTIREAIPAQGIPAQAETASAPAQAESASLEATGAGSALPVPATGAMVPIPSQTSSAGAAAVIPSAPVSTHSPAPEDADSLLTDDYFKKHFHQESLWVASKANLDIGEDHGPANWTSNGTSTQLKNRLTADRIVLYCAKKTNSRQADSRPLFWDWRWCETEEASAYGRLVSGNEFPAAGRAILLGCADVDSYIYLERCVQTLSEPQRP